MKKWLLLGGGVGVAAVAAILVWPEREPASSDEDQKGAAKAAPSLVQRVRDPKREAEVARDIDALLGDNSPEAWGKIASLYPGSSEETKRKVLQRIAAFPELHKVVGYLLATVGEDPRPASDDPMVAETAQLMKSRWKKPEDLDYARQAMLMQRTEKRQWVLASALIEFAKGVGEDSPFSPQKTLLQAKLVDMHADSRDAFIKSSIVDGMHDLGGRDAALILAKGTKVTDDELEGVREERAAREATLKELDAQ
jgi:hypothetical protein